MISIKFIFPLILLLFGVETVFACMCGNTSVCEAYANADAIVIATVKSFKASKIPSDIVNSDADSNMFEEGQEVSIKINKTYKGENYKELNLFQPNSNCDWIFSNENLERNYLFYLKYSKKYKQYRITLCGRSNGIENASDDLSWLNGLPKSLKRTRISGKVRIKDKTNTFPAFANFELEIKGKDKNYLISTDINGLYEVWNLPVGKYRVLPTLPNLYQLSWTSSTPEIGLIFGIPKEI